MTGKGGSLRPRLLILFFLCSVWLASFDASQLPPRPGFGAPPPPTDLDLVLSYVTVSAAKNADVPRLLQDKFHIFEDNKEQKIDYFAAQSQPLSIGIVWGAGTGFEGAGPIDPDVRECPRTFVRNSVPGSEFFLLSGDTVTTSYTTEPTRLPLNFAWSGASSDTLFIGMDVLKEAANPRKILLVITNPSGGGGGQLQSTYVERAAIRLGSTQVHVLSFMSGAGGDVDHEGSTFMNELVELTGGSYYMGSVSSSSCPNLAKELRTQYLIGYHSTNKARDGKWRKLSVKMDSLDGGPKLSARIKRGYYAPKSVQ
jgi:Ca-activated chloride channel family protein